MRLLRLALAALLAFAPAAPVAAQGGAFPLDSVRVLLPVGTLRVDAMDVVTSPRMAELAQKFQAAAQQNQAWFAEHVRNARPGEPLPYDPRLGLTREEYDEFLRLATSMTLHKVAEAQLTVRAEGPSRLVIDGGAAMPDLTGVAIDLASDQLVTPAATVPGSRVVESDGQGAAFGAWQGRMWTLEQPAAEGCPARLISLAVGRLRESGRGVIYWRQLGVGQGPGMMTRILFFDVPR